MANITQMVRVLGCDSKSYGFKSHYLPDFIYTLKNKIKKLKICIK